MNVGIGIELRNKVAAFCVAVPEWSDNGIRFNARYLARNVFSSYQEVGQRLVEMGEKLADGGVEGFYIFMNATEIGMPVVDSIRRSSNTPGIQPVFISAGQDEPIIEKEKRTLGKPWLISRIRVLLAEDRLHLLIPQFETRKLVDEILSFSQQKAVRKNAHHAPEIGPRDDLVTALGLAIHADVAPPVKDSETSSYRSLAPMFPGPDLDDIYDRLLNPNRRPF